MTNAVKNIGLVVAGVIVGVLFSVASPLGGVYSQTVQDFSEGISVDGTVVIDGDGNVDAPITSSTGTFSGDVTFDTSTLFVDSSANRVGIGTTTPLDLAHVENTSATSTLIISTGASAKGGRIILEDHDGAGCSEIAILNGTVAAKTVTCPSGI